MRYYQIFCEGKMQPGGAKIMLRYITRGFGFCDNYFIRHVVYIYMDLRHSCNLQNCLCHCHREESLLQGIQPEELHSKMEDPSFVEEAQLIDARKPNEVAQASLPGFMVLPLRQFGSCGTLIQMSLILKGILIFCVTME
ncbi:hypothetical protein MRB53_005748 [Persea americana]|uniref:Uncharacterized protein n=1 Tax=Persea americana TaxID=3435 RepID=A0ACC2MEY8_PERAE|nr:hypothetical protein MRB53_005748 [Persea americana]